MENHEQSHDYWTLASFIIRGESVDPDLITEQLGIAPSQSLRKGEKPRESDRYKPSPFGLWKITANSEDDTALTHQLHELLDILEPKQDEIIQIAEQASVWFGCAVFNVDGADIPHTVLKRIVSLNADLTVNVYPPNHDIWKTYRAAGGK